MKIGTQVGYFRLVRACLEEICGMEKPAARRTVLEYLSRLNRQWPKDLPRAGRDIIYNEEPINLAVSLAGQTPLNGYNPKTDAILQTYYQIRQRVWGV